jgi:class 3 adenylate cyclase/tetratricopeptide (TPR) repeat protein
VTDAIHRSTPIDDLLERALAAFNRGDVAVAHDLAGEVLAADAANPDAAVLASSKPSGGELRRASLLFADLVGSTALSSRHEPELYRDVIRRYKAICREVIERRYGGHISHVAGDGLFAVFGLPKPHENDAERAVRAALDIVRDLRSLSADVERALGERIEVRCAVHKGLVYLDTDEDDVYGLAANVVARLHGMAAPGAVVISDDVQAIVGSLFDTVAEPAQWAKGVEQPLRPHRVLADRPEDATRGRRWAVGLVNRAPELAILRDLWQQVREGSGDQPRPVHLVGEAGIGKSRLAAVLADEVQATSAGCVQLLGSPFHADASFYAIRALLEGRCGLRRDIVPVERVALLRREVMAVGLPPDELLPLLAPILDLPPEAGSRAVEADAGKLHESIVVAAVRYVLAALGPGLTMLLVEDLHWCDESTIEVLARVLRADRGDLLVVTTSRDPPPPSLGRPHEIALSPLDHAHSVDMVRSLDPALDDQTCLDLVDRGDGVPLFLEELVRGAGPQADQLVDLTRTRDDVRAPSPAAPVPALVPEIAAPSGPVPDALYEPLVARLHATGPGLSVAAAAAAIGRDIDHSVLTQVVDVSDTDLESGLKALLGGLILERALDDGRHYRFRHELLRAVAYDLQPPSRRRELHARVAGALTRESDDDAAVDWRMVAGHYDAAGQSAEAISAYGRAADGARRRGAAGEARAHLTRAIELVVGLPDDHDRRSREVGLRLRRGFLAVSAEGNSSPTVVQDYERCLELGLRDIFGDDMFSTLIPLFGHYMVRGDLDRAHQVAVILRNGLSAGRDDYRPDNDGAFGTISWCAGDFGAARDRLETAVAGLATRQSSPDYAATYFMPFDGPAAAHAGLALARFMRGDTLGADAQIEAALGRCRTLEFPQGPFTAAFTHYYASWILIERGDLTGAAAAVASVASIGDSHGFGLWALAAATQQAAIDGLSAISAGIVGRDALVAHAEAVEALVTTWKMLDIALFLPCATATAGRLRAAAGDLEAAAAHYDDALQFAVPTGMHFYDAEVMRLRAELLPADDAMPTLRAALEVARTQGAVPFELRVACDLLDRNDPAGLSLLAAATSQFATDACYAELDDARAVVATAS